MQMREASECAVGLGFGAGGGHPRGAGGLPVSQICGGWGSCTGRQRGCVVPLSGLGVLRDPTWRELSELQERLQLPGAHGREGVRAEPGGRRPHGRLSLHVQA